MTSDTKPKRGRVPRPLEARYGALTVLREARDQYNRRVAVCQCACGKLKTVLANALYQGYSRSCGAMACRPSAERNPATTRMPNGFTAARLRAMVEERGAGRSVAELAVAYDVHPRTLYGILQRVTAAGGIDTYLDQFNGDDHGEA